MPDKELLELYEKYPNFYELGENIRFKFNNQEYILKHPNDYELGEYIFDLVNEKEK